MKSAFDEIAAAYDARFTSSKIGTLMREAVWRHTDRRFQPGSRVLELNCGTGEDAIHLAKLGIRVLGTDASAEMLKVASAKIAREQLSHLVEVRTLAWEQLDSLPESDFDGALSNFGGLNCLQDLPSAAAALAKRLRPGAPVLLCAMGPWCVWEWAWYLLHGQPSKAFRRLRSAEWRGIEVRYPSIGAVKRAFAPQFQFKRASAIGALLPPPYAEKMAARWPAFVESLNRWERRAESLPPLPSLADHYLIELNHAPALSTRDAEPCAPTNSPSAAPATAPTSVPRPAPRDSHSSASRTAS